MKTQSKSEMRAIYREHRADFVEKLAEPERAIAFSVAPTMLSSHFVAGKTVAGYIPVGSEANPQALLQIAHNNGCSTALPYVTTRTAPMQFLRWSPGDPLYDGPFGLLQPHAAAEICFPDIVLAPLVAFDRQRMRLGQGAGHYDRALSVLERCFVVGVAWSIQEAPCVPTDPWDIPMSAILTEKAWII